MEGVSINDNHSWDDYKLILADKAIGTPAAERITIDVPGRAGKLDVTNSIFGSETVFKNRTITLKFVTLDDLTEVGWNQLYHQVLNAFHGKNVEIIFDSAPLYYYKGFCIVSKYETKKAARTIVLEIDADPYKYDKTTNVGSL